MRSSGHRAAAILVVVVLATVLAACEFTANGCDFTDTEHPFFPGEHVHTADCPGVDLRDRTLGNLFLVRSDFSEGDLRGSNWSNGQFAENDLSGADLRGAAFRDNTILVDSWIGADASGADLRGAYFLGGVFDDVSFAGAQLDDVEFVEFWASGVDFTSADLAGATFVSAELSDSVFTDTLLVPADQTVVASGPGGAVVTWPQPPSLGDASPGDCDHPSGSTFPVGQTVVRCSVEFSGLDLGSYGTFVVTVLPSA